MGGDESFTSGGFRASEEKDRNSMRSVRDVALFPFGDTVSPPKYYGSHQK